MGGGTILGLCSKMLGTRSYDHIAELAMRGNAEAVDLTIGDITRAQLANMNYKTTASNFGKVSEEASDADFAMEKGLFANAQASPKGKMNDFFLQWGERIGLSSRIISMELRHALNACPAVIDALDSSYMTRKAQSVFRYHLKQRLQKFAPLT